MSCHLAKQRAVRRGRVHYVRAQAGPNSETARQQTAAHRGRVYSLPSPVASEGGWKTHRAEDQINLGGLKKPMPVKTTKMLKPVCSANQ